MRALRREEEEIKGKVSRQGANRRPNRVVITGTQKRTAKLG